LQFIRIPHGPAFFVAVDKAPAISMVSAMHREPMPRFNLTEDTFSCPVRQLPINHPTPHEAL
jgi:hypothetical protein